MLKLTRRIAILTAIGTLVVPAWADFSGSPLPVGSTRWEGHYAGEGGEFTLIPSRGLAAKIVAGTFSDLGRGSSWQSFCLEKNEPVDFSGRCFADIGTSSVLGGAGGQDGFEGPGGTPSDSLDARTAYLYQNFRTGELLTDYDYGLSRPSDAGALQDAIWFLEGEVGRISGKAVDFYNEAVEATEIGKLYGGGSPDGLATWTGLGNVRILNVWRDRDRTQFKQDQLVLVPAPGAVLLGVVGLTAIGWIRRRILD